MEAIENKSHNSQSIARNGEKENFEKKVSWQSWFRLWKYVKRKAGQVMQKLKQIWNANEYNYLKSHPNNTDTIENNQW